MHVTVQLPFTHHGRPVRVGSQIEVTPMEATVLRRSGYVTLSDGRGSRVLRTTALAPEQPESTPEPTEPEPETPAVDREPPAAPAEDEPIEVPRRRSRTYKRRDLIAEIAEEAPPVAE